MTDLLINNTIKAISANESESIVLPFDFSQSKENQFLIFFKPEVFFS
jgi:hypothetical protein